MNAEDYRTTVTHEVSLDADDLLELRRMRDALVSKYESRSTERFSDAARDASKYIAVLSHILKLFP